MGGAECRGGAALSAGDQLATNGGAADAPSLAVGQIEAQTAWMRISLAESTLALESTLGLLLRTRVMIERARQMMLRDEEDVRRAHQALARSRRQLEAAR
jgi:hypothetical protein